MAQRIRQPCTAKCLLVRQPCTAKGLLLFLLGAGAFQSGWLGWGCVQESAGAGLGGCA